MHQYMTGDLTHSELWPKHKKPTKPQLPNVHYSIGLPGAFESLSTTHFRLLLIQKRKKKKKSIAGQEQNQPLTFIFFSTPEHFWKPTKPQGTSKCWFCGSVVIIGHAVIELCQGSLAR